jgi:hypothetical protein
VRRLLLLVTLVIAGCSSAISEPSVVATQEVSPAPQTPMTVPLSLHVMVEAGETASELSSTRTLDDLTTIANGMAVIWRQADFVFDPVNVHRIEVPRAVLEGIVLGDTGEFFAQVNRTFLVEDAEAVNGFYVRSAFGVNGFNPQGSTIFFVVDEPSVHDERVSSHELGHILGLHHDVEDRGQLMFSGTNGTTLNAREQAVAQYVAEGLFP